MSTTVKHSAPLPPPPPPKFSFADFREHVDRANAAPGHRFRVAGLVGLNLRNDADLRAYRPALEQIVDVVSGIAGFPRNKQTREPGLVRRGREWLYSPKEMNVRFRDELYARDWRPFTLAVRHGDASSPMKQDNLSEMDHIYARGFQSAAASDTVYRQEIDFIDPAGRVGLEVQFGKYAFLMYDYIKMLMFHRRKRIELGVEIVPVSAMTRYMSSGVGTYESFVHQIRALHGSIAAVSAADSPMPLIVLGISDSAMDLRLGANSSPASGGGHDAGDALKWRFAPGPANVTAETDEQDAKSGDAEMRDAPCADADNRVTAAAHDAQRGAAQPELCTDARLLLELFDGFQADIDKL